MIHFLVFSYFFYIPASSYPYNLNQVFLKDYIFHWGQLVNNYNIINCEKSDSLRLAKAISEISQLFVSLSDANKPVGTMTNEPTTFILHLQCKQWMEVLAEAEEYYLFRKPYQWLLLGGLDQEYDIEGNISSSNSNSTDFWDFLETLSLLIDSDFKVITGNPNEKLFVVSPYKISRNKNIIKEYLAEWTINDGLMILNPKSIARRRWNLQGLILPTTLVITHPESFYHMDDLIDKHKDTTSKVTFNVVRNYEFLFNMSFKYKIDSIWGVPLKNGSWTGMVGDLERGDVEIGSSPLFLSSDRLPIVEYYGAVSPTSVKFIFISPPLSHSSNIFKLPFDSVVWLCCLSLFASSCFFLYIAINSEEFQNEKKRRKITFSEILIINIGAICQQGTTSQTRKPAGRIITIFVYLAYMFLYISYSAAIVAILQSSDTSLQTILDLLRSPMEAGADNVAYSQYYFRTADDEIRKKFYKEKIIPKGEPSHFLSPEEGIKKVRKGLYAFHVETTVGYYIIQKTFREDEKCGLQELKMSFFKETNPWLVMRRYSSYNELFKMGVKRIVEAGFKTRSVRRFYTKKPSCGSKNSRFVSIGIIDCYSAFLLLIYGMLLSFAIMIAEIIIKKYFTKQRKSLNYDPEHFDFIK